jgi:hypothetical protein
MICEIQQCNVEVFKRSLCRPHYRKAIKYGDPLHVTSQSRTLRERFLSKIEKQTDGKGCWLWTGATGSGGYGKLKVGGQRGKMILAHRLSYFFTHGSWPAEHCLHSCDVRRCVNPDHLRDGSNAENIQDRMERNAESMRGGRNGRSKLTVEQVRKIKSLLATGETHRAIAPRFGVSSTVVQSIGVGRTWGWVE